MREVVSPVSEEGRGLWDYARWTMMTMRYHLRGTREGGDRGDRHTHERTTRPARRRKEEGVEGVGNVLAPSPSKGPSHLLLIPTSYLA